MVTSTIITTMDAAADVEVTTLDIATLIDITITAPTDLVITTTTDASRALFRACSAEDAAVTADLKS